MTESNPSALPSQDSYHYDGKGNQDSTRFMVILSSEEAAAVEGWRLANDVHSTPEALRKLILLGLMGEVSEAYETIKLIRRTID